MSAAGRRSAWEALPAATPPRHRLRSARAGCCEAGRRAVECAGAQLGPREAAVAREITKLHEECVTGTLAELADRYAETFPKGEIVVVVGPPLEADDVTDSQLDSLLAEAMAQLSPSRAAAEVSELLGIPRKRAYARALELSRK